MRWSRGFRTATRHLLALVAAVAFGLSAATPTLMHGCAHAQSAAAGASSHQHSHGSEGDRSAPADECRCVGHSCCSVLVVASPAVAISAASADRTHREPDVPVGAPRIAAPHLLPFANGPPAPLLS